MIAETCTQILKDKDFSTKHYQDAENVCISLQTIPLGSSQEPSNSDLATAYLITWYQVRVRHVRRLLAPSSLSISFTISSLSVSVSTCSRTASSSLFSLSAPLFSLYPPFSVSTPFPINFLYTSPVLSDGVCSGGCLSTGPQRRSLHCIILSYKTQQYVLHRLLNHL